MNGAVTRRALLVGAATALACSRKENRAPVTSRPSASPSPAEVQLPLPPRVLNMSMSGPGGQVQSAVILVPDGPPEARYPVLVALHGRGEALKGPDRGAMGWPRDYALTHAIERIQNPPLTSEDLEGFVDPERLAKMNADLTAHPYEGLIVACPYVPDMDLRTFRDMRGYGKWLTETFLPSVRDAAPAIATADATGIDGVSLGGATALRVGFLFPEAFGAVGALQPAVFEDQAQDWTDLARTARARRPTMAIRLLTSHDDYYHSAIGKLSQAFRAGGVAHESVDVPGPHDYPFNRGPGAYELLWWHDRALRRL